MLEVRAQDRRKEPCANDVVRLRTHVHRERPAEQVHIVGPTTDDLRRERRRGPGVHDVGVADETAGCAALIGTIAGRHVGRWVDRQLVLARRDRTLVIHAAEIADRIPDRERHAEEPLTADAPVAVQAVHPVLVARFHVLRMPLQLAAPRDQRVAELDGLEEPLPAGDDFERPVALFIELHGVGDRPRLADQIAALAQVLHDLLPCLRRRQVREIVVDTLRAIGVG